MIGNDRFKIRRRLALSSFVILVLTLALVFLMVFFGSPVMAVNLTAAQGIILTIIACLTGLVAQYSQLVYKEDKSKSNKGSGDE